MIIYLYVKQCNHCGLKYFGKTTKDPLTYNGSGKYWVRHFKLHGISNIETLNVYKFDNLEQCSKFALNFSNTNSIVESKEWANLKLENGLDGGNDKGGKLTQEHKDKISKAKRGIKIKPHSTEHKDKISLSLKSQPPRSKKRSHITKRKSRPHSPETIEKIRLAALNRWSIN